MHILEVNNLRKIYNEDRKNAQVIALRDINFRVEDGEFVAIMGESGSGKSTLLNLIASLDRPTSGDIILKGDKTKFKNDRQRAKFRREKLGFVYQDFSLLNSLSNRDNIYLPLVLENTKEKEMRKRIEPLAKSLKIEKLLDKFPYEISGGQKQRVAVARSLITNPEILLADEPTGALDSNSSMELLNIFEKINENGQTILMVTHSTMAASRASRVLFIKDGKIFTDLYKGDMTDDEMYKKLVKSQMMILAGGEGLE